MTIRSWVPMPIISLPSLAREGNAAAINVGHFRLTPEKK